MQKTRPRWAIAPCSCATDGSTRPEGTLAVSVLQQPARELCHMRERAPRGAAERAQVDEAVHELGLAMQRGAYTCALQRRGIRLAFVAQRIEAGRDDHGGRQAREVRREQ